MTLVEQARQQITRRPAAAALVGTVVGGLAASLVLNRLGRTAAPYDVRGRTVLITGGSRGLGLLLAREFGRLGARIVLVARSEDELRRAERMLSGDGIDVAGFVCDVREMTQVARVVGRTVEHTGGIDVLVNNAGIIQVAPLDHTRLEDYEDSLNTHFWGPLYLIRECLPHMRKRGGGRILNVSSIGGRVAVPHLAPYSVGKFALVGLSEGLRPELVRDGIFVTTATPGLMRTGSHLRARIRGRHEREALWFGAGVTSSLTSMDAGRAARQMVRACLRGRAHVTPGVQARVAELLNIVAPELTATVASIVTRHLLPGPSAAPSADLLREAREVGFGWLTPLLPQGAAVRNNETVE